MTTLPHYTSPLPTAQEMRQWDQGAMARGIPEVVLMENAAREALKALEACTESLQNAIITLFMGNGNNGGDAAALARHLLDVGAKPLVLHAKALGSSKGVTAQHIRMARSCGVTFQRIYPEKKGWQERIPAPWNQPHILVDGLLGTGFEGTLRPLLQNQIEYINSLKDTTFIYSLDCPSGCHALSGAPAPVAVKAHATVSFAAAKPGLIQNLLAPSHHNHVGRLFVQHIGIPRAVQEDIPPSYRLLLGHGMARLLSALSAPRPDSHKNSWGHVLVLGGSEGLSGAAHLAALGALRTGAGLVTVGAPATLCAEVKAYNPNMMTLALGDKNAHTWPDTLPENLLELLPRLSALAIGPGMGTDPSAARFLGALLAHNPRPRAVIDADALTLLAAYSEIQNHIHRDDILTPHPGEAARFLQSSSKSIQQNRTEALKNLTTILPCVWILKGAGALLAQGGSPQYILPYDMPSLAVGGSGDVLTGCSAALLARLQHTDSLTVAGLAMSVHMRCGALAKAQYPMRGNVASDLTGLLPEALTSLAELPSLFSGDNHAN